MWVFDGEEWTEEGKSTEAAPRLDDATPQFDMFLPELQVIEIVPVPQKDYVPFPLP